MVFVLLVSADAKRGSSLREILSAQGWWVTLVPDREGALRAAADQEPEAVIIDDEVAGAADLVKIFSSRNGGPGALVLSSSQGELESFALIEAGADEALSNSPRVEELMRAVERVAAIPHRSSGRTQHLEGRRLTAEEIFGDILEEVEESAVEVASGSLGRFRVASETTSSLPAEQPPGNGHEDAPVAGGPAATASPVAGREANSESGVEIEKPVALGQAPRTDETSNLVTPGEASKAPKMASRGPGVDLNDTDFGQYRFEERIAVGGMAEVWRASMVGLEGFQKTVAIKKILPHLAENEEFVAMFIDEAKLAAQLNHENLVDIYDLGRLENDFFIAMEYVDGKDLRSILNRLNRHQETFPLGLACFIAARTAAALDYAHTRRDADGVSLGLVHRDVSPRNILISHSGNVRLCDFGVAKAVSSVAQTEIGALKGKIQYMSPEQAQGKRVDGRSDIFSLGSVLFEMVTSRRLFAGDSEVSLLDAVRRGVVDEPRSIRLDLPEDIEAIILRALAKDPGDRYSNAGEMQSDLEEALYRLEPKPAQGALAEWMMSVFEATEVPATPAAEDGTSSQQMANAAPEEAIEPFASEEAGDESNAGLAETASPTIGAQTAIIAAGRTSIRRELSRGKFWLGVATGLLLAVLAALALDYWIGRRGEPDAAPPEAIEQTLPSSGSPEGSDAERTSTEPDSE